MKLYLNHTERYPVEQLQMQLFASEPSEFVTAPFAKGENGAVSSLFTGKKYVTATAKITWNGKTGSAAKRLLREQADVRHTRPHFAAELLSRGNAGAGHRAALGRALRRPPEQALDEGAARGQDAPSGRARAGARIFRHAGAGKALCRRIGAYR